MVHTFMAAVIEVIHGERYTRKCESTRVNVVV